MNHSESMRNVHPPLQRTEAAEEARKEMISWALLVISGVMVGALFCLAFGYAAGPVPA